MMKPQNFLILFKCLFICSIVTIFFININISNNNNNNNKYKIVNNKYNSIDFKNRGYNRGKLNEEDINIIDDLRKLNFNQSNESIYFKFITKVYGKEKNTKEAFECKTLKGDTKFVVLEPAYQGQRQALDIYFDTYIDIIDHIPSVPPKKGVPRVLYAFEPPHLRYCSESLECIRKFNWTIGYDKDADIRLGFDKLDPSPFETFANLTNKIIMENKLQFISEYKEKRLNNKLETHQFAGVPIASWFCSNCNDTFTSRTKIASDLIKLITIDSYGSCLNNMPRPTELSRLSIDAFSQKKRIIAQYKFYLAFENANCIDYITEKALHALQVGTVPVYLGHPQTLKYLPHGSYIYIGDFNSTQDLADYLNYLDSNDLEYMKYHSWRTNETTINRWKQVNDYPFKPSSNRIICSLLRKYEQFTTGEIASHTVDSIYSRDDHCLIPTYFDQMLLNNSLSIDQNKKNIKKKKPINNNNNNINNVYTNKKYNVIDV